LTLLQPAHAFLAPDNTLGFGIGDVIELALASLLAALLLFRAKCEQLVRQLAAREGLSMALLALLPVLLRLALLGHRPVPTPRIYDEFSHLLVADTLRHFRLANPPHPLHHFFETFFVIQEPSYSSIYPIGQGLILAIGWTLFGHPWAGVVLSVACFCALTYWMLRGWVSPGWALIGGLLAVLEFGPLNEWMNSYWGGMVTACAGCLVFGALPRLREHGRPRDAVLLGAGVALSLLIRPYETLFLILSIAAYFCGVTYTSKANLPSRATLIKLAGVSMLAFLPGVVFTVAQNQAVTGSWTTLPYQLSQFQYGVPTSLTIQPNPIPHLPLTREQQLDYIAQRSFHGEDRDTLTKFLRRLEYRIRFYRFFLLPPLYIAFLIFVATIREFRFAWILFTFLLFALGTNLFPYFYPRYVAVETPLFVLASVLGLRHLSGVTIRGCAAGREAAAVLVFFCVALFAFWYGLSFFTDTDQAPDARSQVIQQLEKFPGKQVVFVRYSPHHVFQNEWVYNAADIDSARIVWARDLGPKENEKLCTYYHGRRFWLLEPDADPPLLTPYQPATSRNPGPFLAVP